MAASECDVLVVGSGAGGLAAAVTAAKLGLRVVVAEKEPWIGGTTALSGGYLWVPNNALSKAVGIEDSVESARTYLRHEAGNHFDAARVDAFLERGPDMVDFFTSQTAVAFEPAPAFSDYHPDAPGGLPGGRSILAAPFEAARLGTELKRLRPPKREITFFGLMIGSGKELTHFFNLTRSPASAAYVARRLIAHGKDLALNGRGMRLTNGNALAARLFRSALDLGVEVLTEAPVRRLVRNGGRVEGAIVAADRMIAVHRGVVLAAGGFPHDRARRQRHFPHAPTGDEHYSPAPAGNTGEGLMLGEEVGAAIEESYPHAAAWVPVSIVRHADGTSGTFPHFVDRAKPGLIAITPDGRRFVNESNSYHDFVQGLTAATSKGEPRAWLVVDHPFIRRFGLGYVKPFPLPLRPHLRSGYLKRGATLGELAAAAGIDPAGLAATVERYNGHARRGEDPDFHKGSTAYNRSLGDPDRKPNPCIAPIETAPFYAVEVRIGDLGTFAGLKTDAAARVLDKEGRPIPGLFACGNDAASIMGGNYPGGGITLGPAMTFGYIAGCTLAKG